MSIKLQKAMIWLNKLRACPAVPGKLLYFCSSENETCWQRMNMHFQYALLLFLLHIFKCLAVDRQKANAL